MSLLVNGIDPYADHGTVEQRAAKAQPLLARARAALQRDELASAMVLTSDALVLQPLSAEVLALVDAIAAASPDALGLVPLSTSPALTACRARVHALQGDIPGALRWVRHVVTAVPHLPCVAWARDWLTPTVVQELGLEELSGPLAALVKLWSTLPLNLEPTDARLVNVRATAELAARIRREFPEESALYAAEILLRRRLGEPQVTRRLATEAAERFADDWGALVSALNAERDAQHPDAALAYARRALELAPSDGSPLHDAAWAYVEAGRLPEARALFEELLIDFPDYPLSHEARRFLRGRS